MVNEDKMKALDAAISNIEKQFGKGSVMKLGESTANLNVECIPTGSLSLDIALGIGGVPKGRVVEIYGPESSGKTTVALHMVAEVQKRGGIAGFIDAEHALDPVYAKNIGVDIDNLYISQPDSGEQALEITETMVRSGAVDIVIVDSVAALVPKAEIDGDMGGSHVGLQARLMSQALRKLTPVVSKNNCVVIFINQLREKVGVMFGNPETTTGGRALKFYSSVRLDVRKIETLKQNGEVIGNRTRVKIVKNKVAPPFREAEFDILFGKGISTEGDLVDLASNAGIIQKSGAWFSYEGNKIGQGRENAKQFLLDNPEIREEVDRRVILRWVMEDNIELIVTSIKELTKKRRLVYINYEPAFALYAAELRKFGIKDGESVRKEAYDSLIDDVLSKRATIRAMALLKNKDYTRKGLEDKLRDGYYPDMCIDYALEYVTRFGYINDERFAENYVNFKAGNKPRRQIELKLKQKGVDADIISRVCDEFYEDNSDIELEQAKAFVEKKHIDIENADYKELQKVKAALYRKGFSMDIINKTLDSKGLFLDIIDN